MKFLLVFFLLASNLCSGVVCAQSETFDVITYSPPSGWTKQTTDFAVSFSTVDQAAGTWCQLGVYKSVASSGDAKTDFSNEWKALVTPATYAGAIEPAPTAASENGWAINSGGSNFKWQDKDAQVILINASGFGTMVSIAVSMNSDRYMPEVEKFLQSVDLKKPLQAEQVSRPVAPSSPATGASIKVTNADGVSGIFTSTTNFDDGWVARPFADYVRVEKPPVTVLLHYAIEVDDEMRQGNMETILWDRLIVPRYKVGSAKVFQNEPYTYSKIYFVEGDGVEVSTGKKYYVGMRVLVSNGIARCIEIVAPSMSVFQEEFPNQEKIEGMINYNKFAVVAGDIAGEWTESNSSGMAMYNTVTGNYAGMNTSASAHAFTFNGDGTYNSSHKGAYGMTGSLTTFDQKYRGKFTMGAWEVTMTNRFEGKTDVFFCQYEAVRGGRVLHLTDKAAPAMTYALAKVK